MNLRFVFVPPIKTSLHWFWRTGGTTKCKIASKRYVNFLQKCFFGFFIWNFFYFFFKTWLFFFDFFFQKLDCFFLDFFFKNLIFCLIFFSKTWFFWIFLLPFFGFFCRFFFWFFFYFCCFFDFCLVFLMFFCFVFSLIFFVFSLIFLVHFWLFELFWFFIDCFTIILFLKFCVEFNLRAKSYLDLVFLYRSCLVFWSTSNRHRIFFVVSFVKNTFDPRSAAAK